MSLTLNDIKHPKISTWVNEMIAMCEPDNVVVVDGSKEEYDALMQKCVKAGLATKLAKKENCYLFRSLPSDVARVESRTFISSVKEEDAGPTNHWIDPSELKQTMRKLYKGCMHGRTMYVIPFCMGPLGSPISKNGIEVTDSEYVVLNMDIMTRAGKKVLDIFNADVNAEFVPCLHSVGKPLRECESDNGIWPCADVEYKYITQFPEERLIWSYGSGYGGNALLGKKCFALRIATVLARDEGWLAEHMLILKLTNPKGEVKYVTGAFPSACGKTNLAMLIPTIPGWKVETIGDDIAWMKFGKDGRLYAINPEAGFFGVAPGTSAESNKNALISAEKNTIYTNCALTEDGDVWWEGIGYPAKGKLVDWKGKTRDALPKDKAPKGEEMAHPNARFTAPAKQCPCIAKEWEDPAGVPISAILFGGRRPSTIPLVHQSLSWNHGVFLGSIVGSEITAASTIDASQVGKIRRDPFAILPFCGYNMGDYFKHWIEIGKKSTEDKLPKIFYVNWFRKDANNEKLPGGFMWPGYGDNSRVLAWIFDRCNGVDNAVETPIGYMPKEGAINTDGLADYYKETLPQITKVDVEGWKKELADVKENHYPKFGKHLPKELSEIIDMIQDRLNKA
ncbi:MAG: phosphoenolpyruvate carboxykinase (GTP) [Fibrobacter sp.]|jgi:phosphoenolpyruvate carboxykinase (GTP)|uniref:phosphoenolpyruvate carboxykinase (GTP) n=2 Tax=Fibrobacter TaxID=832 RepID=UPI00091B82A0|nr:MULTISPECIES: phosphoenolpyruvate carboxykinase (GTP) [unclassified Fibrobacter]MBO6135294.1 phosphoenolpyruvate carboxykinase (GTP) [Fibrobacter sp.]MBR2898157.1 phosphoenolpyruvate carboxykinase (GTP) [Fibrobacter sp.]MBR4007469.1 phosphoenolpyruvate carboxykinase (GTP) [Fibrobacter sp.]SHG88423.1 phosphoenolpyruvate carboxykinase (GTP) [Fibrobacter sp. UWCM]SHJ44129.1 phosphoenolpyruvate carboxykinase (GTP) [Fibrobacter sp. UWP2]